MNFTNNQVIIKDTSALLLYFYIIFKGKIRMEPMVRPASWNRRNRLMNRQGTVWNRSEPEFSNQVPHGPGTGWNRNRMESERNRPNPNRGHHYVYDTTWQLL